MQNAIDKFCSNDEKYIQLKENAWKLRVTEFYVDNSYQLIKSRLQNV